MANTFLDELCTDLQRINADLMSLEDRAPFETQRKALKQEKKEKDDAVREYMESNDFEALELAGIRYTLKDSKSVKCTVKRLRETLPEDVVAQYVQANTVSEPKFKKTPIPDADE